MPKIKPVFNASIIEEKGKRYIKYSSKCANAIYGDNGLGFISIKNEKVEINPKQKTIFTLTAFSKDGETTKVSLEIDPNATPTPTDNPLVSNKLQATSAFLIYLGIGLGSFYSLRWFTKKIKNAKKP